MRNRSTVLTWGVSEYVSAIILTLIVLISGAMVLIYAMNTLNQGYYMIEKELLEAEHTARQSLTIVASYVVNTELRVIVVTADHPVRILDIYVNNSLVTPGCRLAVGSTIFNIPYTLKPYTAAVILCSLPTAPTLGKYVEVRINFEGGVVAAFAQSL